MERTAGRYWCDGRQAHIRGHVLDRATGRIRGGSQWGPWGAFMPTEADLREAHRQVLVARLRGMQWNELDYQTLCAVDAALPKIENNAGPLTPPAPRP